MAKATKEKLVKRVIVGPKGIWVKGELKGIGETIMLPLRSAKRFARYLEAPGVASAKAAVAKAEAEADEDAEAEKVADAADDKAEAALQAVDEKPDSAKEADSKES